MERFVLFNTTMKAPHGTKQKKAAFTLVEIMIVVAIIGLLSAIAIPSFAKARTNSQLVALQNDLRIFVDAFQMYSIEQRGYPPDNVAGVFPAEMGGYMKDGAWLAGPASGGQYEWHYCSGFSEFMIAIHNATDVNLMTMLDETIDDGNFNTGLFIASGGIYYLRFEQ
jgi:prepilin-type N-terminal cleavage/methylation domain-containing protein